MFRVKSHGFRVWGLGFMGLEFKIEGPGFRRFKFRVPGVAGAKVLSLGSQYSEHRSMGPRGSSLLYGATRGPLFYLAI